jgi:hypothetical protein
MELPFTIVVNGRKKVYTDIQEVIRFHDLPAKHCYSDVDGNTIEITTSKISAGNFIKWHTADVDTVYIIDTDNNYTNAMIEYVGPECWWWNRNVIAVGPGAAWDNVLVLYISEELDEQTDIELNRKQIIAMMADTVIRVVLPGAVGSIMRCFADKVILEHV